MGSKAKGKRHEDEAKELYEKRGYSCWKPANKAIRLPDGRYIQQKQDICGVFDFIAWNGEEMDFVQVKSDESHASKARKKIEKTKLPDSDDIHYIVLMREKRKPYHFIFWIWGYNEKDQQAWLRGNISIEKPTWWE